MKSSRVSTGLCASLALVCAFATAAQEATLIDFLIKDQFHHFHSDEDYAGQIVVVIGSDKDGSNYNSLWGQAIHDELVDEPGYEAIQFLPVADVRGVPFFLKGHVRKKFPRDPAKWALVDWKGRFAKAYAWKPACSNIVVFDRTGGRVHQAHGTEVDASTLRQITDGLRPMIRPATARRE